MSCAHSISTRQAYGVQRVCRVWDRARSSVYARRQATRSRAPLRRRGPVGGVKDSGLGREGIRFAIQDMTEIRLMVVRTP